MKTKGRALSSIAEYELALSHLADWESVPLRRLNPEIVRQRHHQIGKKVGPYAANKTMRAFRAFWNTARKVDTSLGESPTRAVAWFPETRRKSAIKLQDLPTWFREIVFMRNDVKRDLLLLILLTGLRKASASAIRREHINLTAETLHIPRPKGGEAHAFTIPLSDAAMIIVRRQLAATNSEWLFPSATSESGHIMDPRRVPNIARTLRSRSPLTDCEQRI
jgi:integrase